MIGVRTGAPSHTQAGPARWTRIVLAATFLSALSPAVTGAAEPVKNVIELFTSQGCSSCPAADALLKSYVGRPDIIALSFNVDYWDYLGWKDTLGKPSYSNRQRAYAHARGDGRVYTPQIVANGLDHAVGSQQAEVNRAIDKSADRLSGYRLPLLLETDTASFTIKVGAGAKPSKPATVYLAAVSPSVTVDIKRGENDGHAITYHNVVRKMIPVGMWTGDAATIRLRKQDVLDQGGKRCVVIVQSAGPGPILAAGWMPE